VFTENAKRVLDQVQESVATALKGYPADGTLEYHKRTLDAQGDTSKKLAAISAEFSKQVLAQGVALASATRSYADDAQVVLRDQAAKQYDELAAAYERVQPKSRRSSK
jgi:hypothetical protein